MNSIAGFLPTLPPRPSADSHRSQQELEASANSQKAKARASTMSFPDLPKIPLPMKRRLALPRRCAHRSRA